MLATALQCSNKIKSGRSWAAAGVALLVVAVDAASKAAVVSWPQMSRLPFIYRIDNPSYTMGAGGAGGWYLPVLSAVAILVAIWWLVPVVRAGKLSPWPVGLAIGGALGNLGDRVLHGQVTDFLKTPWLIVNMADLAVLAGLVVILTSGSWRSLTAVGRRMLFTADAATAGDPPIRAAAGVDELGVDRSSNLSAKPRVPPWQ